MSHVYLNSLGLNNSLGLDVKSVAKGLFSETRSGLEPSQVLFSGRSTFVGKVKGELPLIPNEFKQYDSRNNQLLLSAFEQIKGPTFAMIDRYGPQRVAVVIGTSTSGISERERQIRKIRPEISYLQQEIGNPAPFLAKYLGLEGPCFTVSTACSSSKKAMISARRLLIADLCDAAIVGGSDSLCELTLNGFDALESVSPEVCNPFSRNRKGINIGEGAALFLMSREESLIRVAGCGESSDGHHISAPDPEGKGAILAIRECLGDVHPRDVGYINLHGTATPKNDEMEARAIHEIFGSQTPASSTKPLIGHSLGAAGAQELAFCYMALDSQINPARKLPLHQWDGEADNAIPAIRLCTNKDYLDRKLCLSNSFAFGGNNAAIMLGAD